MRMRFQKRIRKGKKYMTISTYKPIVASVPFALVATVVAFLLAAPQFARAVAFNDVSLQAGTSLSVNGITINVTGATLSQLQVDSTTFNVTLGPSSAVTLTAPNRNKMALGAGGSDFLSTSVCDGSNSNMTLTAPASAATTTVTITPSSTLCAASVGGGTGGGGGGGGGAYIPPTTTTTTTTTTTATTPATAKTTLTAEQRSALIVTLTAQLNTLLAQLAALKSGATPSASAVANANVNASFKRDLRVGSTGEDAKALQAYLNGHGLTVASSGAGSPGNETKRFGGLTRAALAKFQKSVGITPAYGYFGPKTRAYIAAHP